MLCRDSTAYCTYLHYDANFCSYKTVFPSCTFHILLLTYNTDIIVSTFHWILPALSLSVSQLPRFASFSLNLQDGLRVQFCMCFLGTQKTWHRVVTFGVDSIICVWTAWFSSGPNCKKEKKSSKEMSRAAIYYSSSVPCTQYAGIRVDKKKKSPCNRIVIGGYCVMHGMWIGKSCHLSVFVWTWCCCVAITAHSFIWAACGAFHLEPATIFLTHLFFQPGFCWLCLKGEACTEMYLWSAILTSVKMMLSNTRDSIKTSSVTKL